MSAGRRNSVISVGQAILHPEASSAFDIRGAFVPLEGPPGLDQVVFDGRKKIAQLLFAFEGKRMANARGTVEAQFEV